MRLFVHMKQKLYILLESFSINVMLIPKKHCASAGEKGSFGDFVQGQDLGQIGSSHKNTVYRV